LAKAADRAYWVIREYIATGELAQGTHLKEEALAEAIGVSRTPVREAIHRLATEGVVIFKPNQGAFVTTWTRQRLLDYFEMRQELEALSARQAASPEAQVDLDRLRGLDADMTRMLVNPADPDRSVLAKLNREFHEAIVAGCRNEVFSALTLQVTSPPLLRPAFNRFSRETLQRMFIHHAELIAAIAAQDPAWADAVMRAHVLAARRAFLDAPDLLVDAPPATSESAPKAARAGGNGVARKGGNGAARKGGVPGRA